MESYLLTAQPARDLIMLHHENSKETYLYMARSMAVQIAREKGFVTINDVREKMPPPSDIHASVLGAVFRNKKFVHTGKYTTAKHTCSHARKIGIYTIRENV